MGKIIVFGASGQLGHCLKVVAEGQSLSNIRFLPEESANILDWGSLKAIFESESPKYCINCAAYTAVDKAEEEPDLARRINRDGAKNLSLLCKEYDATLIHVSTDFVFGGNVTTLLQENDTAEPVNVYGLTKLEGEQAIQAVHNRYYILRTSWLYSEFGNNFVKTMLRLGREKDMLSVIADQIGTPTYAIDLAVCILHIIKNDNCQYGIYHYSNEGVSSWYDFAKAIFDIGGLKVKTIPIKSTEYATKAVRPAFSAMDKSKVKKTFQVEIPYWRDSLVRCIQNLSS